MRWRRLFPGTTAAGTECFDMSANKVPDKVSETGNERVPFREPQPLAPGAWFMTLASHFLVGRRDWFRWKICAQLFHQLWGQFAGRRRYVKSELTGHVKGWKNYFVPGDHANGGDDLIGLSIGRDCHRGEAKGNCACVVVRVKNSCVQVDLE